MTNIVGSQKTRGKARERLDGYPTDFNYIDNDLGGYGFYYRTVMDELGIILLESRLPHLNGIDLPTDSGRKLAAAFRDAVHSTRYYQQYFDQNETEVPIDVIQEYADVACLCQLKHDDSLERELLRQHFTGGVSFGTGQDITSATRRRETLQMFLDIADKTDGYAIDENTFRHLIYFGETTQGAKYAPEDNVSTTNLQWRFYQLREYYAYAFNAMWYFLCEWGYKNGGDVFPIPIEDIFAQIGEWFDHDKFAAELGYNSKDLTADSLFSDLLEVICDAIQASKVDFDSLCTIHAPLNEYRIYEYAEANKNNTQSRHLALVTGMVVMLATIYLRFNGLSSEGSEEWKTICRMGDDGRKSVDDFFRKLRTRVTKESASIREVLRWLLLDYVIIQHQLVATSKLPENTFRFKREGNGLRFYQHQNVFQFRDSRFNAISTVVYELGYCGNLGHVSHPLTESGQQLVRGEY